MTNLDAIRLEDFITRSGDWGAKRELVHRPCSQPLCDIEAGDTLWDLAVMAGDHRCPGDVKIGPWLV